MQQQNPLTGLHHPDIAFTTIHRHCMQVIWRGRQFEFLFPRPALVMGILNVTPDSFSDGGSFFDPAEAIDHGQEMISQGADIIDVGGESTRPGASPVSDIAEMERVLPVIQRLSQNSTVPISIDTIKPEVARAALDAGASIVNDIAANRTDDEMWRVVADARAGYVAMHMRGTPATMQLNPSYDDVVEEVAAFFTERLKCLELAGVKAEQVALDVGIGFGKTMEHNLNLIANMGAFIQLQRPLLLGLSRKSFIGKLLDCDLEQRLPASLSGAVWAVMQGVQIVRVHDVAETVQALRMMEAIGARKK